jgi:hypothetical protein
MERAVRGKDLFPLGVLGASFDDAALAFFFPQIHALRVRNLAPVDHQAQDFAQSGQFNHDRVFGDLATLSFHS